MKKWLQYTVGESQEIVNYGNDNYAIINNTVCPNLDPISSYPSKVHRSDNHESHQKIAINNQSSTEVEERLRM